MCRAGSGVILTYNSRPEGADEVVRAIEAGGGMAVALKLDVADTASYPAFKDAVATALDATWNRTDFNHLVNNAGYGLFKPIACVTEAEFEGPFAVHLKGPFFLTQTLLPPSLQACRINAICRASSCARRLSGALRLA